MNNLSQDLKDSAASVINDPFNKSCMIAFSTWCSTDLFTGDWNYIGKVKFKNGDTAGEQSFKGDSLKSLLIKMQAFIETLDVK